MAVVISDFEVVAEPPTPAPATAPDAAAAPEASVLKPDEFDLLSERQSERAARVRAH